MLGVELSWLWPFFISIFILLYVLVGRVRSKYPPGPICFPGVGVLPYIAYLTFVKGKTLTQKDFFWKMSKTYGNISRFSLGNRNYILLSSFDAVYEAYMGEKNVFGGRPKIEGLEMLSNNFKGIIFSEGTNWERNRKITMRSFRSLGIGNKDFSDLTTREIDKHCEIMSSLCQRPLNLEPILFQTFFGIINILLFGTESKTSDTEWLEFYDTVHYLSQTDFSILNILWKHRSRSLVKYLFPIFDKFERAVKDLTMKIRKKYDMRLKNCPLENGDTDCILDFYIASGMETEEIIQCCIDVLLGGIDTVSSILSAAFLLLGRYGQYQDVMRSEIMEMEKKFGYISFEHRRYLHFTQAFIEECYRYFIVIPTFQTRPLRDVHLKGFLLRGTDVVIGEQYSINFNETLWDKPHEFNPYRFINSELGTFQTDEKLLPFGIGKRRCVGEGIGKTEIFNCLIAIVRRFKISLTSETMDNYEAILSGTSGGIIHCPLPHTVILTEE